MNDGYMVSQSSHLVYADRRKGIIISVCIHLILLILLLYPIMQSKSESIEVDSYLIIDYSAQLMAEQDADSSEKAKSSSQKNAAALKSAVTSESKSPQTKKLTQKAANTAIKTSLSNKTPDKIIPVVEEVKNTNEVASEIVSVSDPSVEALRLQLEKNERERLKRERQEELSAVKQKASNEIYHSAKAEFSNLFSSGNSDESVTNDESHTGKILQSSGEATHPSGSGLSGRKLEYAPKIQDQSQATGIIVISLCVNELGQVVSSRYTQKGSTSSDRRLISSAKEAIKQYKFSKSQIKNECGELHIDFKLK